MRYLLSLLLFTALLISCADEDAASTTSPESKAQGPAIFERIPSATSNVTFKNHVEENFTNFFARFQYVYNGGGVAIGDIDGDGNSDVYFTANEESNRLYRNLGDFKFEDITEKAGVGAEAGWKSGTVMADVNGDGHLDIYVCRGGSKDNSPVAERRNLLYINDGKGTFQEAAAAHGLADEGYSLQAVFFDMDNDNDLDVYVTNRPDRFFLPHTEVLEAKARQDPEFSDQLYRNDGGRFMRITEAAGITGNFGYGLGLVTADVNDDGYTDIIVSNDYLENDYLYENQGDGTFIESIEKYTNHTSFYGMGIDAVDLNNDGYEDLLQLDMSPEDYVRSKTTMASMNVATYREIMNSGFHDQYMHNSLQLNRGNGFFSEISQLSGIAKSDWSWAVLGADFDNDAEKEIFITNGYRRDVADKDGNIRFQEYLRSEERKKRTDEENARYVIDMFKSVPLQNYLYDNSGDLTFTNRAEGWGLTEGSFSNGAAYGDLDNDGDLDLVVNNLEEDAFLYRNNGESKNYLRVQLRGPKGNAWGIGAKITLQQAGGMQFQELKTVRGYLSSVEPVAHFGLGNLGTISKVSVTWPDGKESVVEKPEANQAMVIDYTSAKPRLSPPVPTAPLFRETTASRFADAYLHEENDFDDYSSQVLLPHGHSKSGPAIAVGDVDGDGLEDFYVGGAKRIAGVIYRQNESGKFTAGSDAFTTEDAGHEDTAASFFDADNDGDLDLYVVSGGSEFPENSPKFQDRLYLNDGSGNFRKAESNLPTITSSGSCVVPLDVDGDGDQDLFVGGRVVPARYPATPRSFLLENDGGKFRDVTGTLAPELERVGMVTSAVWSDLDADGTSELVVVGEWMPISVFEKRGTAYENVTSKLGLEETQGWWNKIVATDMDGDGDEDYVIGNLGLNYKFSASREKPFYVFASDFDQNGSNDIFLAKENGEELVPIRGRECSSQQIPEIANKFPTYNAFADAELEDIIDLDRPDALRYEAKEFSSSWLENREGRLVLHRLPLEMQFSTINSLVFMDLNKDGKDDLVTAGNKFEVEIETTRADAGVGSVLLGAGKDDNRRVLSVRESGLFLPENVKGLYVIRLGQEKNPGMLVAVNEGPLRLLEW